MPLRCRLPLSPGALSPHCTHMPTVGSRSTRHHEKSGCDVVLRMWSPLTTHGVRQRKRQAYLRVELRVRLLVRGNLPGEGAISSLPLEREEVGEAAHDVVLGVVRDGRREGRGRSLLNRLSHRRAHAAGRALRAHAEGGAAHAEGAHRATEEHRLFDGGGGEGKKIEAKNHNGRGQGQNDEGMTTGRTHAEQRMAAAQELERLVHHCSMKDLVSQITTGKEGGERGLLLPAISIPSWRARLCPPEASRLAREISREREQRPLVGTHTDPLVVSSRRGRRCGRPQIQEKLRRKCCIL